MVVLQVGEANVEDFAVVMVILTDDLVESMYNYEIADRKSLLSACVMDHLFRPNIACSWRICHPATLGRYDLFHLEPRICITE